MSNEFEQDTDCLAETREWQIQEIKNALEEADKGDFASEQIIAEIFTKWGVSED